VEWEEVGRHDLTVGRNAPRSQHLNRSVFSSLFKLFKVSVDLVSGEPESRLLLSFGSVATQHLFDSAHSRGTAANHLCIGPLYTSIPVDWRRPVGRPHSSWMATLKNNLSLHNLTFEDAIKMALDKPLWGLFTASGATHWWCMPNNDNDDDTCRHSLMYESWMLKLYLRKQSACINCCIF